MNNTARTLSLLACAALLLLGLQASAMSAPRGTIANVRVTNLSDKGFTVSWTTNVASVGQVNYGTTPALGSSRSDDPGAGPYTHHVTLTGLLPGTTYYFDVVSGGYTDNNSGAHYTATTGPTLAIPGTDSVYGQVFRPGGVTPVAGAIVYVTVADRNGSGGAGRSAVLSALSDSDGYWFVNLASVRTADSAAYFSYSAAGGDDLELQADDGPPGRAGLTVDLGQSYVAGGYRAATPPLILSPFNLSGVVTLDGAAVAGGTPIAAWCGGAERAATAAYLLAGASWYALVVPGDDPATAGVREGCVASETVTFKAGSQWAQQAVPWVSASLALSLTASTTPPPAPAAPDPTIGLTGGVLRLAWPEDAANRSYEVWRSTQPYLVPGAAGAEILANAQGDCVSTGGVVTCQDTGAIGDAAVNYFYRVRAGNATDAVSDSGWVGKFGFALQPGQ
jgi:hypothetical protein